MTKKTRKPKTNRRQSAARRARKAATRRAKRCRPDTGGGRAKPGQHYVTTMRLDDGTSRIQAVSEAELVVHFAYMDAHRLLPRGYPSSDADVRAHAPSALRTLEDPGSPSESVLRAILVLGHTPEQRALAALRRHASRNGIHAAMARLAADECAWWMESSEPYPKRAPQPTAMLN